MHHSCLIHLPRLKHIGLVLFAFSVTFGRGQPASALRHDDSLRIQQTTVAFRVDLLGELPESLAFDPVAGLWYFGMVKTGRIYRYDPRTNETSLFLSDDNDRKTGVFALEVDPDRHVLYVLMSPIAAFHGETERHCSVYEYHLETGVLLSRNDFYDPDERRLLGDMERYSDGSLFISDSYYPAIMRRTADNKMEEFLFRPDRFWSLQGIALDNSTGILYVADYRNGLFAIDIFTGEIIADTVEIGGDTLKGIDGLSLYSSGSGKTLYAVQNGTKPNRLIAVDLGDDGRTFRAVKALDQNCFPMGEPTNGVFVGKRYFYIANAPWPFFDPDGNPREHEVWKTKLEVRTMELIK